MTRDVDYRARSGVGVRAPGGGGARRAQRSLAAGLVFVGLVLVAGDLVLGLVRVASCRSVSTGHCLGGISNHALLVAGVVSLVAGWGRSVAAAEGGRPLGRSTAFITLAVLPVLAMIGELVGEEALNPDDGAWDGRIIPIRLALLVAAPAALSFAICALRRGRWRPTVGLTIASVAVSYALPFIVIVAFSIVSGRGG